MPYLTIIIYQGSAMHIDIILASYNGEKFIKQQIESIQRCNDYHKLVRKLIVCDDGSTDNTINIIKFLQRDDDKIALLLNESGTPFQVTNNFFRGVSLSQAELIMFADQDDVWHEDKISLLYKKITHTKNKELLLVFSDLIITDDSLNVLNYSFFGNQNLNVAKGIQFHRLLLQNVAPGCSMIVNGGLARKAASYRSEYILMHDWWIILFASYYGEVAYINKGLMFYRQHANNQVGAKVDKEIRNYPKKILQKVKTIKLIFLRIVNQANYFSKVVASDKISDHTKEQYLKVINEIIIGRRVIKPFYYLFAKDFRRHGLSRNLSFLFGLINNGIRKK